MFCSRDPALLLQTDYRLLRSRNERPGKPGHRKAEVVQFPKMHIRADRPALERRQEFFALCFDNHLRQQRTDGLVLRRSMPALLILAVFCCDNPLDRLVPRPRRHPGIAAGEIGLRDLEIQRRLPKGLVFRRLDQTRLVPTSTHSRSTFQIPSRRRIFRAQKLMMPPANAGPFSDHSGITAPVGVASGNSGQDPTAGCGADSSRSPWVSTARLASPPFRARRPAHPRST